ncbi:Asp-tRNA(Asn)/Glu-tRNA(Gln) amidotransferase subunit GatC [Thiolapillus brandeum]|uniref:Aspartyl/glutamyl-tRNA(Asn/Gln) amidotransferase subunit C n=1 Tax=Thiolapillus brandeum TaxID=1076588 RepID=A0A7U6GGI9_9GAMM|nr:Asp-tRNA(Asn)/Glu-tRNA(Gln) amidotransferase subunit GatC [Thiolapillus brandeum]BAO43212.1 glutamyl-tRNA (Gln) amidotransferase subunit C [Thiolapillus brandeum]
MSLDAEEVEKIAHLARIAVTSDEVEALKGELSGILDLVERMSELDTSEIVPMAHPLDMPQRLRPDVVTEENHREAYQAVAPAVENGLYLVPRVIE